MHGALLLKISRGTTMKKTVVVALALALAWSATSASAETFPGWAGSPEPFSDTSGWLQYWGALSNDTADTNIHYFDVPISYKTGTTSVTVNWDHECLGGGFCLLMGTAHARVITSNWDGTFNSASAWNSSSGNQSVSVTIPTGGTVMLQFRFQGPGDGLHNSHVISRIWTSGTGAL